MFKNFNEVITFSIIVIFVLFMIRVALSFIFNINKDSFSMKDQIKFFYRNEDE